MQYRYRHSVIQLEVHGFGKFKQNKGLTHRKAKLNKSNGSKKKIEKYCKVSQ